MKRLLRDEPLNPAEKEMIRQLMFVGGECCEDKYIELNHVAKERYDGFIALGTKGYVKLGRVHVLTEKAKRWLLEDGGIYEDAEGVEQKETIMNAATKIRAAYLRQHQDDTFSLNLTGNIRLLLANHQTPNYQVYSGEPVRLVGGAYAYWKAEDGYFFVSGDKGEMQYLYEDVVATYEVFKLDLKSGDEVISLREKAKGKPATKPEYLSATTVAGLLTAYDEALLGEAWRER
jgi:hypothetical protein